MSIQSRTVYRLYGNDNLCVEATVAVFSMHVRVVRAGVVVAEDVRSARRDGDWLYHLTFSALAQGEWNGPTARDAAWGLFWTLYTKPGAPWLREYFPKWAAMIDRVNVEPLVSDVERAARALGASSGQIDEVIASAVAVERKRLEGP